MRIAERFRGPAGIANGGWVAGYLASFLPQNRAVEVTLRAPTPLGADVLVERGPSNATLLRGGDVLAEARVVETVLEPPPFVPPGLAGSTFEKLGEHPYPGCFVCGDREPGDGLRVYPAPTGRPGEVAALWEVDPLLADWSATLPLSHVWGALDCPTGWAHLVDGGAALLGRLTVRLHGQVRPGERYVAVARATGSDRRKLFSDGALYTESGTLVGAARATWIKVGD